MTLLSLSPDTDTHNVHFGRIGTPPSVAAPRCLIWVGLILALVCAPSLAWSLAYVLEPGSTFTPVAGEPSPLTGQFELSGYGPCIIPCEPDAYVMSQVVLDAQGTSLSNGIVEVIFAGPVLSLPAFEVLPDGTVVAGEFSIERTVTATGTLTDDPHNHTDFQDFTEQVFGLLVFHMGDPKEVLYGTPRGQWPVEVTLAYSLIERTGRAVSGYDGTGAVHANEIVDLQSDVLGEVIFTAVPVPEPGTGSLVLLGMLGLALRRSGKAL